MRFNIASISAFVNLCINIQTDAQGSIDLMNQIPIQMADFFPQSSLVDGTKLFQ